MLARPLQTTSEVRLVPTDPTAPKAGSPAPAPGGPQGRACSWSEAQWTRRWPHWRPLYLWGEDTYLSIQGSRGRGGAGVIPLLRPWPEPTIKRKLLEAGWAAWNIMGAGS